MLRTDQETAPQRRYVQELFAPEDALLQQVRAAAEATEWPFMQMGADEARILQWLVRQLRVKTIVEIGCFVGYSALWMAAALPEDGRLTTLELNPDHAAIAKRHFSRSAHGHKITLMEGDALAILPTLHGPFDMVFMDANKAHYPQYLDWAEAHTRPGSLIVADNTFLFGQVWRDAPTEESGVRPTTWEGMRAVNQRLADPTGYDGILLPTREGLTIAVRK